MGNSSLYIFFHADVLPHFALPVGKVSDTTDFFITGALIQSNCWFVKFEYTKFDSLKSMQLDLRLQIVHSQASNPFAADDFFTNDDADPCCAGFFLEKMLGIDLVIHFTN